MGEGWLDLPTYDLQIVTYCTDPFIVAVLSQYLITLSVFNHIPIFKY